MNLESILSTLNQPMTPTTMLLIAGGIYLVYWTVTRIYGMGKAVVTNVFAPLRNFALTYVVSGLLALVSGLSIGYGAGELATGPTAKQPDIFTSTQLIDIIKQGKESQDTAKMVLDYAKQNRQEFVSLQNMEELQAAEVGSKRLGWMTLVGGGVGLLCSLTMFVVRRLNLGLSDKEATREYGKA